jgi:hypothetical protein
VILGGSGKCLREATVIQSGYQTRPKLTRVGIGRMALLVQLVTLQRTVITLLSDRHSSGYLGAIVHPYHDRIYNASTSVKQESLSALGHLFQRLSTAAPIRNIACDPLVLMGTNPGQGLSSTSAQTT